MKLIHLKEGTPQFEEIKKEWDEKAKNVTVETLQDFVTELTEKYSHDYGTICHAMSIAAVAAAWAVDHSSQGGITGFQAGAVMWGFIRSWNFSSNKTGMRIIDYDNFLYPQYEDKFQKNISEEIWENIQKEAAVKLEDADRKYDEYLDDLKRYKENIDAFLAKYPDYYERREHYDHLGIGTGEQWEAEDKKKASGFEFAPQEPYCPVSKESRVYKHWQSIVSGDVPFGYSIGRE